MAGHAQTALATLGLGRTRAKDAGPVTLDDRLARSGQAIFALVDGDVVALDVEKGVCFGLNATGSRVWEMLDQAQCGRQMCARLMQDYAVDPATCEREVLELIHALVAEGLVEIDLSDHAALSP